MLLFAGAALGRAQESTSTTVQFDMPSSVSVSQLPPLVRQAKRARASGNLAEAERLLLRYLEEAPEDTDQRIALAGVYLAQGELENANREVEAVLKEIPDSPDTLLVRGLLKLRRDQHDGAIEDFEAVLQVAPDYCDALVGLARAHQRKGNPAAALRVLERSEECRSYADVKRVRGQIERGDHEDSPATAGTPDDKPPAAEPLKPRIDADAVLAWARERLKAEDACSAEAAVRQVLAEAPDNTDALVLLGQILLRLRRDDEAVQAYQTVTALAPGYCDAWYGVSDAYIRIKDYNAARCALAAAPASCMQNADGLAAQGRMENASGEFLIARRYLEAALAGRPEDPDFCEALRSIRLHRNTTTLETERFRQTGTYSNLANVFTYRPRRFEAYDVITEWISRGGRSTARLGAAGTWTTCDERGTLRLEARQALDDAVAPSRYSAEGSYRILCDPGTELLAHYTRFEGYDSDVGAPALADVVAAGLRQRFSECFYAEILRHETFQRDPAPARAGVTTARLTYEEERCRTISLGLASGDEVFAFDRGGAGAAGDAYSIRSASLSWREWICENWGVQAAAGRTERGNNNDSRSFALGVFFEF